MGEVSPLDFFKPSTQYASRELYNERHDICKGCDRLSKGRCQECGCFMAAKCRLADAECPLGKW